MLRNATGAIVLALLIGAFLYVWYESGDEPATPIQPPATDISTNEASDEQSLFVPAGWRQLEDGTIVIDVAILAGALRAVWVEYGLEAVSLNERTPPMSAGLGMGTRGEYGAYSLVIGPEKLEPGVSYFYRVAGETNEGEILHTGLNRFMTDK